ncbi:hypothetical protein KQI63_14415 [bacterium]|nr:hypothetical protein [bacterium]
MKLTPSRLMVLLLAISIFTIGCSEDATSPVNDTEAMTVTEQEDVADDFASTLADPDEGMIPLWMGEFGGAPLAFVDPKDGAVSTIADTVVRENRFLTVTRIRNFYDADGNMSDSYDSLTTVAVERLFSLVGDHEAEDGGRSMSINHQDSTWVDGIEPDSELHTLNGEGTRHNEGSFESRLHDASATMTSDYAWTATDIEISTDRETNPFPLSGTIAVEGETYHYRTGPRGEIERTHTVSLTVTFDGTQYALVTMEDGTEYYVDLTLGRPHRGRPGGGGPR